MTITVQELKAKLDAGEDFVFVDVREPREFEAFNIGAKLIPMNQVPGRMEDISSDKNAEIILHCRSGARSGNVQRYLQSQGYTNVWNLTGGVLAWADAYGK